jgi:hypothetical protein
MYPTVKLKCHRNHGQEGATRTCNLEGHSCSRNIVSFKNFPGRRALKQVGRGLRHMLAMFGRGWQCTDMTSASNELRTRFDETMKRDSTKPCVCISCAARMHRPSFITIDASQAYEALKPSFIRRVLNYFFQTIWFHSRPP